MGAAAIAFLAVIAITIIWMASDRGEPEWLLTHSSTSAQITMTSDDEGELRLMGPSDEVFLFSDRPERIAATTSLADMMNQWAAAFGDDAPNATLVDDKVGHPVAVLELGTPVLDGVDVVFPVTVISMPAGNLTEEELNRVHLFIDPPAARLTWFKQCPMGGSC